MTATFAGLGLHADLVASLARQGITEPFPIQELTIADALAGRDVLGKAKTGSGKTLAFGLPSSGASARPNPASPRP
jgi:superfamily II DNA/RNA helicase